MAIKHAASVLTLLYELNWCPAMRRVRQHVYNKWIGRGGLFEFETVVHRASKYRNGTFTSMSGKKLFNIEVLHAYEMHKL